YTTAPSDARCRVRGTCGTRRPRRAALVGPAFAPGDRRRSAQSRPAPPRGRARAAPSARRPGERAGGTNSARTRSSSTGAMQHTPVSLHFQGVRVGILPCHQREVGGPFATVTDYFWREDPPWLVLQLPHGRRVAAPAAWTDLQTDKVPVTSNHPLLHAS